MSYLVAGVELDSPTPCLNETYPFDTLIDAEGRFSTWTARYAAQEAINLCNECPIRLRCHTEHDGEPWLAGMRAELRKQRAEREKQLKREADRERLRLEGVAAR